MVSVFIDQPFATRARLLVFHAMSRCASAGTVSSACRTAGSALGEVEALAGLEAQLRQLRQDRLVGQVRRLPLQDLGGVAEELRGGHRVHLELGRRLHVDRGVGDEGGRGQWLAVRI